MLKTSIDQQELEESTKTFPVFWWKCGRIEGYVKNKQDLVTVQDLYQKQELNILNVLCTPTCHKEAMYSFGMNIEQEGPLTLREFLKYKAVDISNINLYG